MNYIEKIKLKLFFLRTNPYLKDQKGILNRYYREKINWDTHLQNCKNFIINNLGEKKGGKVAILGSGWLLDVPIMDLCKHFDEVWLFDINHPNAVVKKYSKYKNIKWVEADLTNDMIKKVKTSHSFDDFMISLNNCPLLKLDYNFDLVISINILNQLDILLCDYLKQKFSVKNQYLKVVSQKIQYNHVKFLSKHKQGILITDCEESQIKNNKVFQVKDLIYTDISNLNCVEEWMWIFDTHKLYNPKFDINFKVKAFIL